MVDIETYAALEVSHHRDRNYDLDLYVSHAEEVAKNIELERELKLLKEANSTSKDTLKMAYQGQRTLRDENDHLRRANENLCASLLRAQTEANEQGSIARRLQGCCEELMQMRVLVGKLQEEKITSNDTMRQLRCDTFEKSEAIVQLRAANDETNRQMERLQVAYEERGRENDVLKEKLQAAESEKFFDAKKANEEVGRLKLRVNCDQETIAKLKNASAKLEEEFSEVLLKAHQDEVLYEERLAKEETKNSALQRNIDDLSDQVVQLKRQLELKDRQVAQPHDDVTETSQDVPTMTSQAKTASRPARAKRSRKTGSCVDFGKAMRLSEMFNTSSDGELPDVHDADDADSGITSESDNVEAGRNGSTVQGTSFQKVSSLDVPITTSNPSCLRCDELTEQVQNLTEKHRLQHQISSDLEQNKQGAGLDHWADVAINIVLSCGNGKQEKTVEELKAAGLSKMAILRRLIGDLNKRAVDAEKEVAWQKELSGTVNVQKANFVYDVYMKGARGEKRKQTPEMDKFFFTLESSDLKDIKKLLNLAGSLKEKFGDVFEPSEDD